jgi:CheY-like chemotaxis protein
MNAEEQQQEGDDQMAGEPTEQSAASTEAETAHAEEPEQTKAEDTTEETGASEATADTTEAEGSATAGDSSGKKTAEAPKPGVKRRILVVEDSPPLRRMVEKLLQTSGFEVDTADNGSSAYQKIQAAEPPYALMVLDIMMPVMDGIRLMAKLQKEEVPNIPPVVICSSRSDRETVRLVSKLGAAGYILKPFKTETVVEKVRQVLAETGQAD